jgi:hypothetical protein
MQVADPLAQLHPLREPPDPGWWPPAPGWWLLAALVLLALLALAWLLWRHHRQRRYRREAIARLEALHAECTANPDMDFGASCNRLLKSVALRSFPRRQVASLSGEAWIAFLNDTAPGSEGPLFEAAFAGHLYRPVQAPEPGGAGHDSLYRAARKWIRRHGARP